MTSSAHFTVELLPARHGDCLWVEYGSKRTPKRLLIDGGPVATYPDLERRLREVKGDQRRFELIVMSHVDADHVEGILRLFSPSRPEFSVGKVWFNGWRQLEPKHKLLGPEQGEFLSALLTQRVKTDVWDANGLPMVVPDEGALPQSSFSGITLTLISPSPLKLKRMKKEWENKVRGVKLTPGDLEEAWRRLGDKKKFLPKEGLLGKKELDDTLIDQFKIDPARANGSSIAFLAEVGKKSVLFLADAHPDVVVSSVERLCKSRGKAVLEVDAVKVAHHGSKANTSKALLEVVKSPRWIISTNGDIFGHPDKACMERLLKQASPQALYFNYDSDSTRPWIKKAKLAGCQVFVRGTDDPSLKIDLNEPLTGS
jgi:hypothetical protein